MPVFSYTAKDRTGRISTGTLEAESDSSAVTRLREQGLWVTDLKSRGGARRPEARVENSAAKQVFRPVSLKDLALFYRQLHTLLNAGMPLYGSLETLAGGAQTPNAQLRKVVQEMANNLLRGGNLSGAMLRFPWLFDKMQIRLVEAGEAGGLLVEILERLATYLEREYELRMEVKQKTLYPKILLLALLFIPPVPTLFFSGPIAYLAEIWRTIAYLVMIGVPLYFGGRLALTTQAGKDLWDQVKLAVPVIGPLVRKLAVARFCRSLAALYGAGVPIASALALSGEACGNYTLEQASARAVPALEHGASIAQTLEATRFFKPMMIGMVSTGEATGSLDSMLYKVADFYEDEARHAIIKLVVILGVVLLLIMAIMIAIKVIGFWTGYLGTITGGGGGAGVGGE